MIVLGICRTLTRNLGDTNAENEEKQEQSRTTQNTKFTWITQYRLRPWPLQLLHYVDEDTLHQSCPTLQYIASYMSIEKY